MTASPVGAAAGIEAAGDLTRALDASAVCTELLPLAGNLFEITFQAPELAGRAEPGEFSQIWVDPRPLPLLRRPFSFSRVRPDRAECSFYLAAVGQGSRRLRDFRPGDRARLLGPLGRGFTLPEAPGRSVLLAGGLGAAPFPLLAERLLARGEELLWINGARTAPELYPDHLLPEGLGERWLVTEDGSRGERGRVSDQLLERLAGAQRLYACGPNPMLAKVAELVAGLEPGTAPVLEVSIEAPMGCGFGTCLGCSIPLARVGSAPAQGLCCRRGPVLRSSELDWGRLLAQPAHLG
ncbi:MAG: hypothetical protein ACREOD_02945 [Candidatus Dormibacteria bacterium]